MARDYLKMWADELLAQSPASLRSKVRVIGERDKHLGPMWEFAKIQVSAEPSSDFEVIDEVADDQMNELGYLDWAILGLLDILMVAEGSPISRVRIVLEKAERHPVDSTRMAFRQAGRDAGRKIIQAMKQAR